MNAIISLVGDYVSENIDLENICKACFRDAKSQKSHDEKNCIMESVINFVTLNREEIINFVVEKEKNVSRENIWDTVCSPSCFASNALLIAKAGIKDRRPCLQPGLAEEKKKMNNLVLFYGFQSNLSNHCLATFTVFGERFRRLENTIFKKSKRSK